ncbi:MAG: hypothetical protein IKX57_07915 [Oscillospiraceae bacterium]|nr:hypothetical protein [Oscillospiraceae bacterium]
MKNTVLILWIVWTVLTLACAGFALVFRGEMYTHLACVTLMTDILFGLLCCAVIQKENVRKKK